MRKKILLILPLVFALITGGVLIFSLFKKTILKKMNPHLFGYLKKVFFVNYEITENNTVKFRYSICFENHYDKDMTISLSAKFKKKDTWAWLAYDFIEGCNENGDVFCASIKSREKINIVFVFEGEYLCGTINENLSFPEELILTHSF